MIGASRCLIIQKPEVHNVRNNKQIRNKSKTSQKNYEENELIRSAELKYCSRRRRNRDHWKNPVREPKEVQGAADGRVHCAARRGNRRRPLVSTHTEKRRKAKEQARATQRITALAKSPDSSALADQHSRQSKEGAP